MESQRVQEALPVADTAREQQTERRRRANRWYYPVLATLTSLVVLAFATGEPWLRIAAIIVCIGANIGTSFAYRNATDAPVPRLWQGPATLYAVPFLVLLVAAVLLVRPAVEAAGSPWAAWLFAVATFAATLAFGALLERAIRLRESRIASGRR